MPESLQITGRFAPSPTGSLHTGSLVAAVGSYLFAKSVSGKWLLRIDDLDTPRVIPGMADDIMRTLESFGLEWDGDVAYQSRNTGSYAEYFQFLSASGHIYPCSCSRREIAEAASAPHPEADGIPYPGTCRAGYAPHKEIRSYRLMVPDDDISYPDITTGGTVISQSSSTGDFIVRRADGIFAYQLAVVVDDHLSGVNQVVRGRDLLASTARQIHIQRILGIPVPAYGHLPLVTGPGGAKLSKRDNAVSCSGSSETVRRQLLADVLRFLGQKPPDLKEPGPCREMLAWACRNFTAGNIPSGNGEILPADATEGAGP